MQALNDQRPKATFDVFSFLYVPCCRAKHGFFSFRFTAEKRKKELKKLEYLVYHYGIDDPTDCYSFIQQDAFVSYDDGIAEGYGELPAAIQAKVDAGDELTEEEEQRVRGIKEMKEDALKEKGERKRGNWQFKERHELLEAKEPAKKRQKKT